MLGLLGIRVLRVRLRYGDRQRYPVARPANHAESSENGYIYAADGTVLAVLRGDEAASSSRPTTIAPIMKQAIVAVEDRRF